MLDFKTLNLLWKIENLAPPSKKWSSPEKTSILPKKLDETYLFRLASYFCMCRKVRFRPKFLSRSKFRSCRKFKSKFFKILEPPKISAFQNFTYNVGEFLKTPRIHQFWKTWIWISKMIEISNSTEISNETSICYTCKNMMQAERDMFHPVFLGRIDSFSGELHFLEGDTKFSIFTKIWKQNALAAGLKPQTPKSSKIRASTRIHANFDLNQRNSAKLKAQNKRINHQNFHANGEIFEKRKKSSVAHLQNSTWQTNTHNTELPSLYYTI